jgi:hypothetical protein
VPAPTPVPVREAARSAERRLLYALAEGRSNMGILGDRYLGDFGGHSIELVRDNVAKTLSLVIDGKTVAWESRVLPHDITLTGDFTHGGERHTVVAHSTVKKILGLPLDADDGIEIDGKPLPLRKVK